MERYDLAIIGAGPGGYVAAERAGHRGLKTVIIEKSHLGGVCLNEGCIPSKALLKSAKLFHELEEAAVYGVKAETLSFDLTAAMKRKTKIIETLRKGVAYQMRQNHVDVVEGHGRLTGQHEITVGDRVIGAEHIIIATGSSPIRPPIPGADQAHVLTSSELFQIEKLPENLVIVGGGVIGMEFACFFSSVGVNVTVIEMLDEVLPPFDAELAQGLRKALKKVKFILGARVENITGTTVEYRTKDGDALESVPADMVLLSVGRKPNSADLGLEQVGIAVERGAIVVDERLQTNVPGIYAVGDVNGRSQLAHAASRMGEVVVNNLTGREDRMRYGAIPYVVYTNPEIAACGMTEEQAKAAGADPVTAKLAVQANGRYLCEYARGQGFVKVVVDRGSRVLLGVHMIGNFSSEIIAGAAAMIEAEFQVEDIRDVVFAHPTVAELVRDAVWNVDV